METRDGVRRRLRAAVREVPAARERVRVDLRPILQQTCAATGAWLISRHLVHHHEPLFAPVAAVLALNASRCERGANAVRLLLGGSCLTLTRAAMDVHTGVTHPVSVTSDAVRALSRAVGGLGLVLGDLDTRRNAAAIALGVPRGPAEPDGGHDTYSSAVRVAVRRGAIDIMLFAGVDKDKVAEAERAGGETAQELDEHVPAPVKTVLSRLSRFRRRHPRPDR